MSRNILDEYVLMLNKGWTPIDTCTVKSAFGRIFMETARFMDTSDDSYPLYGIEDWLRLPVTGEMPFVTTSTMKIRIPEIIVLNSAAVPKRRVMQFSRRNLARRDRMTCQYCGCRPGAADMTVDHVVPKSRGGQSAWLNCVMSCLKCNSTKKNRTPAEAGMALRIRPEMKILHPGDKGRWNQPYEPAWSPVFRVNSSNLKESWKKFLPEKLLESIHA